MKLINSILNTLFEALDGLEAEFHGMQISNCETEVKKFENEIEQAKEFLKTLRAKYNNSEDME